MQNLEVLAAAGVAFDVSVALFRRVRLQANQTELVPDHQFDLIRIGQPS